MAEIEKKPVKIVETVLRDAHQSLLATRMSTDQMLPIVDKMDQVGYYAVECWGGATFDSCLRFLKEDPWERLRKLRAGFKNTKLHPQPADRCEGHQQREGPCADRAVLYPGRRLHPGLLEEHRQGD